ncbi:MAG: YCF48-related protein, partial [Bacillota bacterium]|nr:YCF48-related protein [Bacillota bacterium]
MRKNYFQSLIMMGMLIVIMIIAALMPVFAAELETRSWRQAFQVSISGFGQFTYGGFLNSEYGIAVGHYGEIRYTTDGGKTWKRSESETSCRYGLDIVNDKVAWNCGDADISVGRTVNGGTTWQTIADIGQRVPDHCRFISFPEESIGWVADLKKVKKTADAGKNWVELTMPAGCVDLLAIFLR